MGGSGPFGSGSGGPVPVTLQLYTAAKARQTADTMDEVAPPDLMTWDGRGMPT